MKFANVSVKKDAFENALEHIIRELPQSIQWSNDGHWICFRPEDLKLPSQGWKIHLSVVPGEGAELLRRITPVLTEHGVQWKVVNSGLKLIETSNGSIPLPQTGKCVTIYAANEKQFLHLLEDMHVCTIGFDGPAIPTDRSYRGSACVFYRYGAFTDRFYYDRYSAAKVHAIQNIEEIWRRIAVYLAGISRNGSTSRRNYFTSRPPRRIFLLPTYPVLITMSLEYEIFV